MSRLSRACFSRVVLVWRQRGRGLGCRGIQHLAQGSLLIGLDGPHEASVGESVYLIMLVSSASRSMQPHGMINESETATHVRKFVAGMIKMRWPHCFRMDKGGEFTSRGYVKFATSRGSVAITRPRVSRNRTRFSKAPSEPSNGRCEQKVPEDQGYDRGVPSLFTNGFEPVARVTLFSTHETASHCMLGAAWLTTIYLH